MDQFLPFNISILDKIWKEIHQIKQSRQHVKQIPFVPPLLLQDLADIQVGGRIDQVHYKIASTGKMGNIDHPFGRQQENHETHVSHGKQEETEDPVGSEILSGIIKMYKEYDGYKANVNNIEEVPRAH
jgi:hypothetical protein